MANLEQMFPWNNYNSPFIFKVLFCKFASWNEYINKFVIPKGKRIDL